MIQDDESIGNLVYPDLKQIHSKTARGGIELLLVYPWILLEIALFCSPHRGCRWMTGEKQGLHFLCTLRVSCAPDKWICMTRNVKYQNLAIWGKASKLTYFPDCSLYLWTSFGSSVKTLWTSPSTNGCKDGRDWISRKWFMVPGSRFAFLASTNEN